MMSDFRRTDRFNGSQTEIDPEELSVRRSSLTPAFQALDASSGFEVVIVREKPKARSPKFRSFEVWTKNRIYGLDAELRCFVVLDRQSGKIDRSPAVAGYKLGGGRLRTETFSRLSYPFPVVGMEAMLTDGKKRMHTSRVERFVIRIRELQVKSEEDSASWEDLAVE